MRLSHLGLRARLRLGFSAMILAVAALGVLSTWQLRSIHANTEDIATNWLPSVAVLGNLRLDVNQMHGALSDLLLARDAAAREAARSRVAQLRHKVDELMSEYEPLVTPGQERVAFENDRQREATYLALQDRTLQLAANDASSSDAVAFYDIQLGPAEEAWNAALTRSVDINLNGAKEAYEASKATYAHARTLAIGMVLLAMGLGLALTVLIVRSVMRQLGGEPMVAADIAREVAAGNLALRIALRKGDSSSVLAQLKTMQASLADLVTGVRRTADRVATASTQIAQGTQDLSQRTEMQASAVEETAASTEQLNQTVRQNAENARQANQMALGASGVAAEGGRLVREVVETMHEINDSSRTITEIIAVIDGIAFQTNILSLNAAVEAARAGEHGRGFAVVAGEVRMLAQRSADAAKEIKSLIVASVERVEKGAALVERAGATMDDIVSSVRRVTDIIGEITAASDEQSAGIGQVGEAVTQLDRNTQQNAALVEESAAAAESLRQQAQSLVEAVSRFRVEEAAARGR